MRVTGRTLRQIYTHVWWFFIIMLLTLSTHAVYRCSVYNTCLVSLLQDMCHMCPFGRPLRAESSQGKEVKVRSPSARSVMAASRFSSGRDGFALGEEKEYERRRTMASSGFWLREGADKRAASKGFAEILHACKLTLLINIQCDM